MVGEIIALLFLVFLTQIENMKAMNTRRYLVLSLLAAALMIDYLFPMNISGPVMLGAATFEWDEANGAGQTVTHGRAESNWKNIDDSTTAYTASPIVAGNNSFEKWQYGHFSGTYNQLLNGLWAHTAGVLGTGLTLKASATMTADGDRLAYTTPSTTANALLTLDATTVIAIGSGKAVWFGITSPSAAGKSASSTANPAYTNYLTTQLQTTVAAGAGDTATVTLTLRYDEN